MCNQFGVAVIIGIKGDSARIYYYNIKSHVEHTRDLSGADILSNSTTSFVWTRLYTYHTFCRPTINIDKFIQQLTVCWVGTQTVTGAVMLNTLFRLANIDCTNLMTFLLCCKYVRNILQIVAICCNYVLFLNFFNFFCQSLKVQFV